MAMGILRATLKLRGKRLWGKTLLGENASGKLSKHLVLNQNSLTHFLR